MKKKVAILLAAFMLTGLLAGCGKDTAVGRDVSKYVTVGNYKGVEVTVAPIVPEAAEVEAYALNLYQSSVTAENGGVVDRAVALGDTANIDYVGKKDGVALMAALTAVTIWASVPVLLLKVLKRGWLG